MYKGLAVAFKLQGPDGPLAGTDHFAGIEDHQCFHLDYCFSTGWGLIAGSLLRCVS